MRGAGVGRSDGDGEGEEAMTASQGFSVNGERSSKIDVEGVGVVVSCGVKVIMGV
jgi:hypothetical protein